MTDHLPGVRSLADCEIALFIVYTLPADALERGYEAWLRSTDNPFFNSVSGVWHYTNWKIDRVSLGAVDGWTHFDFLGMRRRADLEEVWFSPDLDRFRAEWVKLWGPPRGRVSELYGHSYLLEAGGAVPPLPRDRGTFSLGTGEPSAASSPWRLTHAVRKHFVPDMASRPGPWLIPAAEHNPLGLDWITLGEAPGASLVLEASRIAGPD